MADADRIDADWTVRTADAIDAAVGMVRDRAVRPVVTAARWAVYGALAAIAGVTALVLMAVGVLRALDIATGSGNVWVAHLIAGGLFLVPGMLCLRRASRRRSRRSNAPLGSHAVAEPRRWRC